MKKLIKQALRSLGYDFVKFDRRPNIFKNLPSWEYQSQVVLQNLELDASNSIIIDIGSGAKPNPLAKVLTDFYPDESFHRAGSLKDDVPVVICSVDNMPFADNAFSFSFCTHVLEHVPDVEAACREISRISQQGLVETPRYGKDFMLGTAKQHLWLVVPFAHELHFYEYDDRERAAASAASPIMRDWCSNYRSEFQSYFWEKQFLFNALLPWQGQLECRVFQRTPGLQIKHRGNKNVGMEGASELTEPEISTLLEVLVSRHNREAMYFCRKTSAFLNDTDGSRYPVVGKRVFFEVGLGDGREVINDKL